MELRIQTAEELSREEETLERVIDMILDLLIEIEEGDVSLLEIEKQFIPGFDIGAEKLTLFYKRKRVPYNVMKGEGLL